MTPGGRRLDSWFRLLQRDGTSSGGVRRHYDRPLPVWYRHSWVFSVLGLLTYFAGVYSAQPWLRVLGILAVVSGFAATTFWERRHRLW